MSSHRGERLPSILKVSIGMPVYNGEHTIKKALDSLLSQTFPDFELIISDNASTDSTPTICKEYAQKDKRIRYIRQKEMRSMWLNFLFVLQEAKYEYFMWSAADDIYDSRFIEKNLKILESNPNVVGSISDVRIFQQLSDIKSDQQDSNYSQLLRYFHSHDPPRSYGQRIRIYLKFCNAVAIYSLFRTDVLKKNVVLSPHCYCDMTVLLRALKHGDLHVIDEVLMYRYSKGISTSETNFLKLLYKEGLRGIKAVFPYFHYTFYAGASMGPWIFIENLGYFIKVNCYSQKRILINSIQILKNKINKKD
jgi:glycosyltransferase involved in cell wall biosynthesis